MGIWVNFKQFLEKLHKLKSSTFPHLYIFEGINSKKEKTKGEILGFDEESIRKELQEKGIQLFHLRKKILSLHRFEKSIRKKDILLFIRHLSTLLRAGIPLVSALDMLSKEQNKRKNFFLFQSIKNQLLSGNLLYEAFSQYPRYFKGLFIELVRVGELSSTLEIMLTRLAEHLEKTEQLNIQIRKALHYPLMVLSLAGLLCIVLLCFVMPQFERIFITFGKDLPAITRRLLNISHFISHYGFSCLTVCSLLALGIYGFAGNHPIVQKIWGTTLLRLPLIGNAVKNSIMARINRCLSTLLTSGLPLLEALNHIAALTKNPIYTKAILNVKSEIALGEKLYIAMRKTKKFPHLMTQMIAVGEEAGHLPYMLDKIAEHYEKEVSELGHRLNIWLEPTVLTILATLIGGFILAMYFPIFKLGSLF